MKRREHGYKYWTYEIQTEINGVYTHYLYITENDFCIYTQFGYAEPRDLYEVYAANIQCETRGWGGPIPPKALLHPIMSSKRARLARLF